MVVDRVGGNIEGLDIGDGWGTLGCVGLCWVGLSDSGENGVRKNRDYFE